MTNNLDVVIFDGTNKSYLTWLRVTQKQDRSLLERDKALARSIRESVHGSLNLTGTAAVDVVKPLFRVFPRSSSWFANIPSLEGSRGALLL